MFAGNPRSLAGMDYDWNSLDDLRTTYLEGTAGQADYWSSATLLEGYDATFARRIAWKWQYVLGELTRVGWAPPLDAGNAGTAPAVVDWGCGTGVAVREVLKAWPEAGRGGVWLHDRSPKAVRFASEAVKRDFPEVRVQAGVPPVDGFILLISHVLTELTDAALTDLLALMRRAAVVLWVEPGTSAASQRLVQARESLRETFQVAAPCTHRARCGLLAEGHEQDWCHFFAPPPNEVFTDAEWVQFGRVMGIDLRSLPLCYLVLDRREPAPLPEGTVRLVGRHRLYKGHALLDACDASGVNERRFTKRTDPPMFRAMNKHKVSTLQQWTLAGNEITSLKEL